MGDLARRLLAASPSTSDPHVPAAMRVCETLRISLTRFAGADGFKSLLSRALALASAEIPSLESVKIGTDGRLEGFGQLASDSITEKAAVAITANLLALLVTFIGESLTLSLVREAWPDIPLDH